MTASMIPIALSVALLIGFGLLAGFVVRRRKMRASELEQKWREAQARQLASVQERMRGVMEPAPVSYPELPDVPLAGLLAPPRLLPQDSR